MNKKNKKYIGFGERPSDKDFFKITKTQYDATPEQNIGNYELILNTPTVKAYLDRPVKTIMLSIRGTTDSRDVGADAMIPFNRLKYSNRYNEDKNIIANLATQYPPEDYDYYATGHSLGMALMRQLQREFPFIKNTVGFNGAIQPYDIIDQKANLNKSYYTEDDALYKLGGRLLNNKVVIPSTVHTLKIPGIIPSPAPVKVGQFVYNASQGHKLDNFEGVLGGAISRMREKLLKMTVKEIKEAVKNELNGAIKGYSKMKKEDLIDAIRDYQKRKKKHVEPIKSEEPKKATPTKKLSKKEEFEKDERHKKIIYLAEVIVDHLKTLNKWVLELKKYGKLHKYCRKYNKYNSTEEERQILEKYMKKYDSTCYRAGRNSDDTLSSIRNLVEKIKGMFNGYYNRNYYREWYQKNYPEEYKKLPMVYVKDNFNFHFFSYNITDDEKLKLKSLVNKLGMDYSDVEKLENEADIIYNDIQEIDKKFFEKKEKKESKKKVEPIKIVDISKYKYSKYIDEMDGGYFHILITNEPEFIGWINWINKLIEKMYKKEKTDGRVGMIYRSDIFFTPQSKELLNEAFEYLTDKYGIEKGLKLIDSNIEQLLKYLDFDNSFGNPVGYFKHLNQKNKKKFGLSYSGNSDKQETHYNHNIKGGSRCMCHVKHIVKGGAIEERKIESLEDFSTTELRKIASIFNKFFKIKLTKLKRDEILRELKKYIYLADNGSIFVNEDEKFFSLKPNAVIKEIEERKKANKLKRDQIPKTRRQVLQKEKISDLKALLISLGGNPTYKLNGRITQLPKRSVIDEILVLENEKKKNENLNKSEEPKKKEMPEPLELPEPEPTKKEIEPLVNKLQNKIEEFEKIGREHGAVVYDSEVFIQTVAYIALLLEYESKCAIINPKLDKGIEINSKLKSPLNFGLYSRAKELSEDLLDCINRGDELIAIPLGLRFGSSNTGHANMLIYRPHNKTIERFEPHGSGYRGMEGKEADDTFNKILERMFEKEMKPYLKEFTPKFISPDQICPRLRGFQALEGQIEKLKKEGGGFCGMWSLFVLELMFINPTKPTAEVIEEAFQISKEDPQYLRNVIRGYVVKTEKMLDDYIKKIDANDGFKFTNPRNLKDKKVKFQEKLLELLLSFGGKNSQIKGFEDVVKKAKEKGEKFGEIRKLLLSKSNYDINNMLLSVFKRNFGQRAYSKYSSQFLTDWIIDNYINPTGKRYNKGNEKRIFKYYNIE